MRLRHRDDADTRPADDVESRRDYVDTRMDDDVVESRRDRDDVIENRRDHHEEAVDRTTRRWDFGSALAVAAGVALIVIGAIALARTGVNETWYEPVETVAGMDHTPLLGAIEVGVGVLLVIAGLAGARMMAAFVAIVAGVGAVIAAIEPNEVEGELAIEQEWATGLAIAMFVLAFLLIVSRERRHDRRIERRTVSTA
jgi:hypothetical protein